MDNKKFASFAMNKDNPNYEKAIKRESELYKRDSDIRSEFARDYTRLLHSLGYRRLKHKTQVFFNGAGNDHICTRIEHVAHVESVSSTIARSLGLNDELTKAIAIGHDIGHAPFGHSGESIIRSLTKEYLNDDFWHEKNGMYFVDNLELLLDPEDNKKNLDLTYAVRDGIISHCGEVDDNGLFPRDDYMDLANFEKAGMYNAVTWEGCVVKLADKIAYLGRDIEDAKRLSYFNNDDLKQLRKIAEKCNKSAVNTTVITHSMIVDICENSSPEKGLRFSDKMHENLMEIKEFNYRRIYLNDRLKPYNEYAKLIINSLFEYLKNLYEGEDTLAKLLADDFYNHDFVKQFANWVCCYVDIDETYPDYYLKKAMNTKNKKIYSRLETKEQYYRAVIDFIAGMTDNYAVSSFNELLSC